MTSSIPFVSVRRTNCNLSSSFISMSGVVLLLATYDETFSVPVVLQCENLGAVSCHSYHQHILHISHFISPVSLHREVGGYVENTDNE